MNMACPGCGGSFPPTDQPTHRYIGASPGCWAVYGQVLAREYEGQDYFAAQRWTVDAYAAQHPGVPSAQSVQSVAVHLIGLFLAIDRQLPSDKIIRAIKMAADHGNFHWLNPPSKIGTLAVLDILEAPNAAEHHRMVSDWARSVWASWSEHHATIRSWANAALS